MKLKFCSRSAEFFFYRWRTGQFVASFSSPISTRQHLGLQVENPLLQQSSSGEGMQGHNRR